jgi:flagellar biosynthesis protein FliR
VDHFNSSLLPGTLEPAAWLPLAQGASAALAGYVLVAARLTGLVAVAPPFSHPQIPLKVRALLVMALSLVVAPIVVGHPSHRWSTQSADVASAEFLLCLLLEGTIGCALGLGAAVLMSGLQLAGSLIDQQVGTSVSTIFNPQTRTEVPLTGELLYQFGMLVFLVTGGHYLLIGALVDSFQALPLGEATLSTEMVQVLSGLVHQSSALALKVSFPLTATLALVSLFLGILGRSLPQLDVLGAGFPIRALVGFVVLGLTFPIVAELVSHWIPTGIEQMQQALPQTLE